MESGVSKTALATRSPIVAGPTETPAQTVDRVNEFMRWLCQVLGFTTTFDNARARMIELILVFDWTHG